MSQSNYRWAVEMLETRYSAWTGIDDILADALRTYVPPCGRILDVGCGKSSPVAEHKDDARLLVGADIDVDEIKSNRECDVLVAADGAQLPFGAGRFDLLLSKTAIEHMQRPEEFFASASRVLKPGGVFIWATSNLRSLPVLASRLTPLGVHRWVYRRLFGTDLSFDQFPTYYRANTETILDRQLAVAGFERLAMYRASWPLYFAFSRALFRAMLPVHRWTDRTGTQWLQVHLIGVHRKR